LEKLDLSPGELDEIRRFREEREQRLRQEAEWRQLPE
jgi:hypothetical protein